VKKISLLNVTVANFKSIRSCTVNFPQTEGLRFLSGENQQEPNLGANGAGKSTLWRAIQWCLYGDGRLSILTSWGTEQTTVVTRLDICGIVHDIKREGPPEKVYLDVGFGFELVEQRQINNLLGLTKLTFPHAVVFNQGYHLLPDLSIPERGELLEEVLRLSFWSKCSEVTTAKLTSLDKEITVAKNQVAVVEGKLLGLESLENLEAKKAEWEENRVQQIQNLETQSQIWEQDLARWKQIILQNLTNFSSALRIEVEELEKAEKAWYDSQKQLVLKKLGEFEKLEAEYNSYEDVSSVIYNEQNVLSHCDLQLQAAQKVLGQLEFRQAKALEDIQYILKIQQCRTCGQVVSEEYRQAEVAKLSQERLDIQAQSLKITEEVASRKKQILELTVELNNLQQKDTRRKTLSQLMNELEKSIEFESKKLEGPSPYKQSIEKAGTRANPYTKQYEDSEKEVNPYTVLISREKETCNPFLLSIAENRALRNNFVSELLSKQEEVKKLESKRGLVEYWKQGFKRLRIFLINRVLKSLEIEVNSAASSLGLVGWQLSLTSETTTKSDTVKLGVQIQVKSPESQVWVPWESWSGGEAERLKRALSLGLASMLQRSAGVFWSFEVYDEPTTFLSVEGVENLLATLDYRSEATKKSIWVVDHVALNYSGFKEIWKAVKTVEGTKILQGV